MVSAQQMLVVFTVGHSTRSLEQFIELIKHYGVTRIIDIRTVRKSRHNPQFNEEVLSRALKKSHIKYTPIKELGGLRRPSSHSVNLAWHNASFRGFADYMQTDEFKKALERLIGYASHDQVAIMCAEAVPWRCHRSLIGDALLIHGIRVEDIFSLTSLKPHTLTPWARVHGDTITYPEDS